jgi:pSer/pThr/pTyr-binding forkhead associated (FHA) protein
MKRTGGAFPDRIGVGRAASADVCIPLAGISKYHAYFNIDEETGDAKLYEAKALNGTFVDGARLKRGEPAEVKHGSVIAFGDEPFLFLSTEGLKHLLAKLAR